MAGAAAGAGGAGAEAGATGAEVTVIVGGGAWEDIVKIV